MGKLSEEEKQQWKELFIYVEKEILGYDDNQKLQKKAVLRLKGLTNGQIISNNKCQKNGNYSPLVILNTFKINRNRILYAIQNKEFESEEGKVAYCCAIIRDKINDVYTRMQRVEKNKQKENSIDTSIIENVGVKYREHITNNNDKKFPVFNHEELW